MADVHKEATVFDRDQNSSIDTKRTKIKITPYSD